MNKLLFMSVALLGAALGGQAAEKTATFDFTAPASLTPAYPADYDAAGTTEGVVTAGTAKYFDVTGTAFTADVIKVTGQSETSNAFRVNYTSASIYYRISNGSTNTTLTIESTDGSPITAIAMAGDKLTTTYITAISTGEASQSSSSLTWTGNATSVVFTCGGGSSPTQINSITVTYSVAEEGEAPLAPTFSLDAAKTYYDAQSVELSAAEGCDIYYTTDGTDPAYNTETSTATGTKYVAGQAITVSATTTIKAIAVKGGLASTVATATYTIATRANAASIAEAKAIADGSEFVVNFDMTVGYCHGSEIYATDAAGDFILIAAAAPDGAAAGTVLKAGWHGTLGHGANANIPAINPSGTFAPATAEGSFSPTLVAAAEVTKDLVNHVIRVDGVTLEDVLPTSSTSKITATCDGATTLTLQNHFGLESYAIATYNITAVVAIISSEVRLYPTEIDTTNGIDEVQAGIDPAAADYYNLQGVRVDPATARGLLIMRQGARAAAIVK